MAEKVYRGMQQDKRNRKKATVIDDRTGAEIPKEGTTMNENIKTIKSYDHILKQAPDNVMLQAAVEKCNREQIIEPVANVMFQVAIRDGLTKDELKTAKAFGLSPAQYKKGGNQ